MSEQPPEFPQYPPQGMPVAHPKQSAPLFKLAKFMTKPNTKPFRSQKARKTGKRIKFH